jgi:hypothetical protein
LKKKTQRDLRTKMITEQKGEAAAEKGETAVRGPAAVQWLLVELE